MKDTYILTCVCRHLKIMGWVSPIWLNVHRIIGHLRVIIKQTLTILVLNYQK